jgi:uncharacterized membrane protein YbaN (DUF454 family)
MKLKDALLTAAGILLTAVGAVGIFVPLLPTTPFLLLAAAAFSAGNPRMHRRLMETRYIGEYIRNYRDGSGVSRRTKALSLAYLWLFLALSAFMMRRIPWMPFLLVAVGAAVTAHVLLLKGPGDRVR